MAVLNKERVKETTTATGSAVNILMDGPVAGFQGLNIAYPATTVSFNYTLLDGDGVSWEAGIATHDSGTSTTSRNTIFESTNSGNRITLSASTHTLFVSSTGFSSNIHQGLITMSSTLSVANTSFTTIMDIDSTGGHTTDGMWNIANPTRITPPNFSEYWYRISCGLDWDDGNGTGIRRMRTRLNGSTLSDEGDLIMFVAAATDTFGGGNKMNGISAWKRRLNSGTDFFEVQVLQNSGVSLNLFASSWFCVEVRV